jgi:hypothetical protein
MVLELENVITAVSNSCDPALKECDPIQFPIFTIINRKIELLEGFILWVEGDGENAAGKKGQYRMATSNNYLFSLETD